MGHLKLYVFQMGDRHLSLNTFEDDDSAIRIADKMNELAMNKTEKVCEIFPVRLISIYHTFGGHGGVQKDFHSDITLDN